MHHYCTLFDRNYLSRGLALHGSLLRHGGDFRLHVLCLDLATRLALASLALPRVELISIEDLETWDRDLRTAREGRTPPEFYFTCKPVLLGYLLERHGDIDRLSYLDSDLYFFSDAAVVERECAGSTVALTSHRFSELSAGRRRFGEFNAGWLSVDSGLEARRFVTWWRDRCIEWCHLVVEATRFGDQKYLDRVPSLFPGTKIVSHPGMNLGPWNLDPTRIRRSVDSVTIDGWPLVFFHFHATRRMLFNLYDCGLYEYGIDLTPEIRDGIYRPYLADLADCERQASALPAARRPSLAPTALVRQLAVTVRALARHSVVFAAT